MKNIFHKRVDLFTLFSILLIFIIYKWSYLSFPIFYEELIYFHPSIAELSWIDIFSLPLHITHGHPPGIFIIQKIISIFTTNNNIVVHFVALLNSTLFLLNFYSLSKMTLKKGHAYLLIILLITTPLFLTHSTLWVPDLFILNLSLLATTLYIKKFLKSSIFLWFIALSIRETTVAFPLALLLTKYVLKKNWDFKLILTILFMGLSIFLWQILSNEQIFANLKYSHRSPLNIDTAFLLIRRILETIFSTFGTLFILLTSLTVVFSKISKIKSIKLYWTLFLLLFVSPFFYTTASEVKFLINFLLGNSPAYTLGLTNIIDAFGIVSLLAALLQIFFFISKHYKRLDHIHKTEVYRSREMILFSLILIGEFIIFYILYNDLNMRDFLSLLPFFLLLFFYLLRHTHKYILILIAISAIFFSYQRNQTDVQWKLLETEAQYKKGSKILINMANEIKKTPNYNISLKCLKGNKALHKVSFLYPTYGLLPKKGSSLKECTHFILNTTDYTNIKNIQQIIFKSKFDNEVLLLYHE